MSDAAGFAARLEAVLSRIAGPIGNLEVRRLSGGASLETYSIEADCRGVRNRYALRRAQHGGSGDGPGPAFEANLMRSAQTAGVPGPIIYHVLEPADALGEGFIMQWLDGETLGRRIAESPELASARRHMAFDCGMILGRIHRIDPSAIDPGGQLARKSAREFVDEIYARYQTYGASFPILDYSARWLRDNSPAPSLPRLVHGDFRNGNLIVAPEGIVAVLDWEQAHVGDPHFDLGWLCCNSWRFGVKEKPVGGFGDYTDLLVGYHAATGIEVDPENLRYWEIFSSFYWAVGCLSMVARHHRGEDASVERLAIGRRSSECQFDLVAMLLGGPLEATIDAKVSGAEGYPSAAELAQELGRFLKEDVYPAQSGRLAFLARVAANTAGIIEREQRMGEAICAVESVLLRTLDVRPGSIVAMRAELGQRIEDGRIALDDADLVEYLRRHAANQLAVDQPGYRGIVALDYAAVTTTNI